MHPATRRACTYPEPSLCSMYANCHECQHFDGFELTITVRHGCGNADFCTHLTHLCFDCLAAAQPPVPRPEPGTITVQNVGHRVVMVADHDKIIQADNGQLSTVYRYERTATIPAGFVDDSAPTPAANDALESGVWG